MQVVQNFLGGKPVCTQCGFDQFPALDFHHLDPLTKELRLADEFCKAPTDDRIRKVCDELKKCIVLCSNCHRMAHHYVMLSKLTTGT